jgi:hypothetical protein
MKKLMLMVMCWVAFLAMPAFAVNVIHLYHADLPVSSQSDDERALAVQQGFSQLLIKLTGNPDIEKNAIIKAAIKRADYYVQEFSYSVPTTASSTYFIHLVFEPHDVNRLLHKAGITFWGERRPLILVWLVASDASHVAEIISNETPGTVLNAMKNQGDRYGLPLIFPLMDVVDMDQVTPEEVSAVMLPILRQAGKRYAPNAYLIGKIETKLGGCESQWQLVINNNQWAWSISNSTPDAVIADVFYQTSQTLSKYFEVKS